jgi:methylenetetrahydrofolate reductase (NADPH)
MKLSEVYKKKKTVLSFEIYPPKRDTELENIDETLKIMSGLKPDFISVTFGAGGTLNNNRTIMLANKIKYDYGIEPLVHLTCLNYNKEEIDYLLNELRANGIENVLALRGDRNPDIEPKKDFSHATELVQYLHNNTELCIAGACYPECHPESVGRVEDISHLKEKTDAGAEFLITQLFCDNRYFYDFEECCRIAGIQVPISAGIMPVINKAQTERITSLCGATLPEQFRKILNRYGENKEALFDAGMTYALSQMIDLLANHVQGIHLYTMNNPVVARRICDGVKNILESR